MSAPLRLSGNAQIAHAAATSIEEHRHQLLNVSLNEFDAACKKAAELLRRRKPGYAEATLARAGMRVATAARVPFDRPVGGEL